MKKYILILIIYWLNLKIGLCQTGTKIGSEIKLDLKVKALGDSLIDLKKYDDRLLIIDFLTTYCTSCIEAMPKNNRIQSAFSEKVKIIPITSEKKERAASFFSKNEYVRGNKLTIGVEDTVLSKIFPYQSVSHVVWIYKGKLIAITMGDMLTEENVRHVLAGNDVSNWPIKNDFFQVDETIETSGEQFFSSKLSAFENGATTQYEVDTIDNKVRVRITNAPIIGALNFLFNKIEPLPLMKKERIVLNVPNLERYDKPDTMPMSIWLQKYSICYESTWGKGMSQQLLYRSILTDLSNRLGIEANLDQHIADVWSVNKVSKKSTLGNKKTALGIWLNMLEIFNPDFPPIVLDKMEDKDVLIKGGAVKDFESLKEILKIDGFGLKAAKRKILALFVVAK